MESARKRYTFTGSSEEIQSQLAQLQESDKESEEQARTGTSAGSKALLKALGAGAAGFVLGLLSEQVLPKSGHLADVVILGLWGLGLAGFCYFAWRAIASFTVAVQAREGDIEDARYLALGRLHHYLMLDASPSTQFAYELDFRRRANPSFRQKSEPYRGGEARFYSLPVLKAHLKLKDGSVLSMEIEQRTRERVFTRVNPRGKVKTKTKTKWTDIYRVQLKIPHDLGHEQTPVVPAGKALLNSTSQPRMQISGRRVSAVCKQSVNLDQVSIEPLLTLVSWVYLNLQVTRSKARR